MTPSARIHSVFIAKRKTWWWTEGWLLCCNLLLYCCLTSCPQRELTSPGPVTSSWPVVTLTRRRRRRTATRTTSITAVRKDCKKTKRYKNTKQNHVNNKTEIFGSLFVFSYGGEQRGRRLWKLSDWEEGGGSGPKQKVCRAWRTLTDPDLWPLLMTSDLWLCQEEKKRQRLNEGEGTQEPPGGFSLWYRLSPGTETSEDSSIGDVQTWDLNFLCDQVTSDLWPGPAVKLLLSVAPSL